MFIITNKKAEVFKIETTLNKELVKTSGGFIFTDRKIGRVHICFLTFA